MGGVKPGEDPRPLRVPIGEVVVAVGLHVSRLYAGALKEAAQRLGVRFSVESSGAYVGAACFRESGRDKRYPTPQVRTVVGNRGQQHVVAEQRIVARELGSRVCATETEADQSTLSCAWVLVKTVLRPCEKGFGESCMKRIVVAAEEVLPVIDVSGRVDGTNEYVARSWIFRVLCVQGGEPRG